MSVRTILWKLASPYDAYLSHVAALHSAIERIRYYSDHALRYHAGLEGSVRMGTPGSADPAARAQRFREQLAAASAELGDDDFEQFLTHLGGGDVASVEAGRERTVSRMNQTALVLEEQFAVAGRELAVLEQRNYDPERRDVARQLRSNNLPSTTLAQFRHELHELGARVSAIVAAR